MGKEGPAKASVRYGFLIWEITKVIRDLAMNEIMYRIKGMKHLTKQRDTDLDRFILALHGSALFQLLRSGVTLNVFAVLHEAGQLELEDLAQGTKVSVEKLEPLVFGLSSIGLLFRDRNQISNASIITEFFERGLWELVRSMVDLQAAIMYRGQEKYPESIINKRNCGLQMFPGEGETIYERLSFDENLRSIFFKYMQMYSKFAAELLLDKVDFTGRRQILDVGGGGGAVAAAIASRYLESQIKIIDKDFVSEIATSYLSKRHLGNRVTFEARDIFESEFPAGYDDVLFVHQLVIWGEKENRTLLSKAHDCLNTGGRVIIFNSMSNDDRTGPLMAGLDTVYFQAIATGQGQIYPYRAYEEWLADVGFSAIKRIPCDSWTPHGIVLAEKA